MYYLATFHPQVWVNDHAMSADPQGPTEWDATRFIQAIPASKRALLLEPDTNDSDALREDPVAPQWIRDWSGPYFVSVDEVETLPDSVYHSPATETSLSYQILLRVCIDRTTTALTRSEHAAIVIRKLEALVGRGLLTDHEPECEIGNYAFQPIVSAAAVAGTRFRVTVKPLVPREDMDSEDQRDYDHIIGDHDLDARDEDDALDRFHGRLAIACLDDFEITCSPLRDYRVIWSTDVPDAVSPEAAAREAFDALRDNLPTGATFDVVDHLSDERVSVSVNLDDARAAD